jgi:uncharacterized protein (TIGR03083 family)
MDMTDLAGLGEAPRPWLRRSVLDLALARRAPGRPVGTVEASPIDAYRRAVTALDGLLSGLSSDDWASPVPAYRSLGWTVHAVVGHLVAIEAYVGSRLGGDPFEPPPGTELDHIAMTLPTVEAQLARPATATLADWRAASDAVVARLDEGSPDLDRRIGFHGLPFRLGSLLVTRAFELWIHADDIRDATGREREVPQHADVSLMTDLAVRGVRTALAVGGCDLSRRSIRIVLTGPGGGAWSLGTDPSAAVTERVRIVADAEAFCRLAARRLDPGELDADIAGDAGFAAEILTAASAFAA